MTKNGYQQSTAANKKQQVPLYSFFTQKPTILSPLWWQYLIAPAFLSIVTMLYYRASLWYPFQFDDLANITKNFHLRFYTLQKGLLHSSRWIGELLDAFSFSIGRFDPFYYRIINIMIHSGAGVLVYFLIIDLCDHSSHNQFLRKNSLLIAFMTSGLFLLHPIQTQTVSYVIQARLEGLATLFSLGTLLIFVKAFRAQNGWHSLVLYTSMFLLGFVSCGTKEIVVVTPLLAIIIDWFFLAEQKWSSFKQRSALHLFFTLTIVGTILYYLDSGFLKEVITLTVTTGNNKGNVLTGHAFDTITASSFLISQFKVILHYLLMFIWPSAMCVEYDWKLCTSFFAPDAFFPFLVLLGLGYTIIFCALKKKYSYISFGLLWFFCAVAPRSSIIPSSELICDYKTYLASVGWLFLLASAIIQLISIVPFEQFFALPISRRDGHMAALIILSLLFGYTSMERNKVWSSPIMFWQDIVKKAPRKARGHNNLGVAYAQAGEIDKSIPCYEQAIKLDAFYTDPYNNIAVAYTHKGDIDNAIIALNRAIALFPAYPEAYNNRGSLYRKKKNFTQAHQDLTTAITLRPHYGKAHFNLGQLYLEQKKEELALASFNNATHGDLDTMEGFHIVGQLSLRLKKFPEAVEAFQKMIKAVHANDNLKDKSHILNSAHFNLANSYFMNKEFQNAETIFKQLLRNNPLEPRYVHNLAETYYTQGNIEESLKFFRKAAHMPTTLPQTHLRIANCLEQLKRIPEATAYLESMLKINAPEEFKKTVQAEIARISIQAEVDKGKGQIEVSKILKAMQPVQSYALSSTQV